MRKSWIFVIGIILTLALAAAAPKPAEAGKAGKIIAGLAILGVGAAVLADGLDDHRGYSGGYYYAPEPAPSLYYGANIAPQGYGYFQPRRQFRPAPAPRRYKRYKRQSRRCNPRIRRCYTDTRRVRRVPKHIGLPRQNYRDPTWRRATKIHRGSRLWNYCRRYGC